MWSLTVIFSKVNLQSFLFLSTAPSAICTDRNCVAAQTEKKKKKEISFLLLKFRLKAKKKIEVKRNLQLVPQGKYNKKERKIIESNNGKTSEGISKDTIMYTFLELEMSQVFSRANLIENNFIFAYYLAEREGSLIII